MPTLQGNEKYSTSTGVIFLFNLIVGTGALTLPSALQEFGFLLGAVFLLMLALFSFITVTFIVEAMAAANALSRKRCGNEAVPLVSDEQQESLFEITEKFELGEMGVLMSPKWSQVVIYCCLCMYLYGDLTIYEVVIGTTASQILCSFNRSGNKTKEMTDLCFENHSITVKGVNCLAIAVFIVFLAPLVFSNVQKTKSLQIFTSLLRWLAFFIMLIWSICKLSTVGVKGHPPVVDIKAVPLLFGTSVYSFMCQHSIPGLLHPINNKKHLTKIIGFDFSSVAVFYLALCLTAIFTFEKVLPIYSLNFWGEVSDPRTSWILVFLAYYLALFPIFTLTTSFPIIAITLRNNLRTLFLRDSPPVWYLDNLVFPLLTILPPTMLSLFVHDIHVLVGVVGSYAGMGVQYLIPCLLVQFARSHTKDFESPNIHVSPFKHKFWLITIYTWMGLSLALISLNYILKVK